MRVVSIKNFRCHEIGGACIRLHVVRSVLGQTKIDYSHLAVLPIHDVLRLDVTMSNSQGVAMSQGLQTLKYNVCCLLLGVWLTLLDALLMIIKQLSSCAQLHHQVQVVLVIVGLEVLYNVGMVNFSKEINLIHDVL